MCVCVCVRARAPIRVSVEARGVLQVSCSITHKIPCILRQGPSLNLVLTIWARPASQQTLGIYLSLALRCWVTGMHQAPPWVAGDSAIGPQACTGSPFSPPSPQPLGELFSFILLPAILVHCS